MLRSVLAAVLLLALPRLAVADATTLVTPTRSGGLTIPGTSASIEESPAASVVNPAGLAMQRGLALRYLHQEGPHGAGVDRTDGDGLYLGGRLLGPLSFGIAHEWLRPGDQLFGLPTGRHRRMTWSLALGGELMALGASAHVFYGGILDDQTTWDLGLLLRPDRAVSVGFVIQDLDATSVDGVRTNRRYVGSIGARPFGDWLTLSVEGVVLGSENESVPHGFDAMALGGTGRLRLVPGATFFASFAHRLDGGPGVGQLGLALDFDHLGLVGTPLARSAGGTSGWVLGAELRTYRERGRAAFPLGAEIAHVQLDASTLYQDGGFQLFPQTPRDPVIDTIEGIAALARDPTVAGLLLEISEPLGIGMGTAFDLHQAIQDFRATGKPVVAHLYDADDATYYVATAADTIVASPEATFLVNGFVRRAEFLADTLDLIGVTVEAMRIGAYKNAPDALTRSSISEEEAEVMRSLLDETYAHSVATIAKNRGLTEEEVRTIIQTGVRSARSAMEAGLVDELAYSDELADAIWDSFGGSIRIVERRLRPAPWTSWSSPPEIAVIPIVGTITDDESSDAPWLTTTSAHSVVAALESAAGDPRIRAILLRIDSGGGGAGASQRIWRAVTQARERKPVIAVMGNAAASGGYYAAVGADQIYAAPTTLTGSIGIFWLKPSIRGLLDKLRVGLGELRAGEQADITGIVSRWSPGEREAIQAYLDDFYADFLAAIAEDRGLEVAEVDAVAQGRVWTGSQAYERELLDELGGLPAALRDVRLAAGLSEDAQVRFRVYRRQHSLISGGLAAAMAPKLPTAVESLLRSTIPIPILLSNETGAWALAPFAWRAP